MPSRRFRERVERLIGELYTWTGERIIPRLMPHSADVLAFNGKFEDLIAVRDDGKPFYFEPDKPVTVTWYDPRDERFAKAAYAQLECPGDRHVTECPVGVLERYALPDGYILGVVYRRDSESVGEIRNAVDRIRYSHNIGNDHVYILQVRPFSIVLLPAQTSSPRRREEVSA